jgi:hypothetical protein
LSIIKFYFTPCERVKTGLQNEPNCRKEKERIEYGYWSVVKTEAWL